MRSLLRLAATELKLFVREPMVLTFVFAFPVLTVLILGGVFDDDDPRAVALGTLLGAFTFISIGIALGMALPSARSAQGLGMLLFFPFFLLGGAGPPPDAMGDPMRTIANAVPLTHVVRSIQEPWLDLGSPGVHFVVLAALAVLATAGWMTLSARTAE